MVYLSRGSISASLGIAAFQCTIPLIVPPDSCAASLNVWVGCGLSTPCAVCVGSFSPAGILLVDVLVCGSLEEGFAAATASGVETAWKRGSDSVC